MRGWFITLRLSFVDEFLHHEFDVAAISLAVAVMVLTVTAAILPIFIRLKSLPDEISLTVVQ